jgi:hypothetical protein
MHQAAVGPGGDLTDKFPGDGDVSGELRLHDEIFGIQADEGARNAVAVRELDVGGTAEVFAGASPVKGEAAEFLGLESDCVPSLGMAPAEFSIAQSKEGAMQGIAVPEPEQVLRFSRLLR